MGLVRLILGFDKKDYIELKDKVESLEERIEKLEAQNEDLRNALTKLMTVIEYLRDELGQAHNAIAALVEEVDFLRQKLKELEAEKEREASKHEPVEETLEPPPEMLEQVANEAEQAVESHEDSDSEVEKLVIETIKSGITSPSDIINATGLSRRKVYAVLRKLSDEGVLEKKREGRKVHYVLVVPIQS
ncbi:MAG: hypothetical protein F7C82_01100 [Desulfurococcales archaeon]|nr:hypothetical protein [Desulfurococcales archaeon]MCE4621906.1 hypothetical protein [Desulfurococcales archaeon]MCE4626026.1 hypothetical protein [Desulfurococcales archaeon]MCE4628858.1 hypothetical protein [Desulfurococcales archaeon]